MTGGSGYIASFCIAQLLNEGFRVRTTARSLQREPDIRAAIGRLVETGDRLRVCAANLEDDAGWHAAAAGCSAVLHVASPLPPKNPKNDDELVRPAREGTLRVLEAAREAGVRRVVTTSSVAAIAYGRGSRTIPFTEVDWSDETALADTSSYERSKTIAERAAWQWLSQHPGGPELVMINPGMVLGPVLGSDFSASIEVVKKLIDRSLPGLPRFGWPLVDVRDIADLHVRAMRSPVAAGQRYIGAGSFYWMTEIARVLREQVPEIARRVPRFSLPDWLLRLSAVLDPVVRDRLFELNKFRPVSAEKAKRDLGWSPRPAEETIVATAQSLIAQGVVSVTR